MTQFSEAELDLMRQIGSIPPDLLSRLTDGLGRDVHLTDEDHDLLVTAVGEHLAMHGFDRDYRPTVLGTALERLMDVLNSRRSD